MKSIDTLIPDIEALFGGHSLLDVSLDKFSSEIALNFKKRFERYGTEYSAKLYLSNVGKPLRQLWFMIKSGLKGEPLQPSAKLKFLYGDVLEDLLLLLAVEAGHTVTELQKEVEVDGVRGRIDCLIDGVLVDVKSASTISFEKFKTGSVHFDDPFGYIGQLAGYSYALGGLPAYFFVVDKTLGHLCLLKLTDEELHNYDVRQRIALARGVLERDSPPDEYCYQPKPDGKSKTAPNGNGNYILPTGCSYCDFKFHCWKDSNEGKGLRTFIYSTGPKFFVKVQETPRVQEITKSP